MTVSAHCVILCRPGDLFVVKGREDSIETDKINRYISSYRKEYPFHFYFVSPVSLIFNFTLRSSSFYLSDIILRKKKLLDLSTYTSTVTFILCFCLRWLFGHPSALSKNCYICLGSVLYYLLILHSPQVMLNSVIFYMLILHFVFGLMLMINDFIQIPFFTRLFDKKIVPS